MNLNVLRAAVITASVVAGGCGLSTQPQPLVPSQFVRSRNAVGPNPIGQPVGASGALDYGELHSPLVPDEYSNKNPKPSPGVSPLVQQAVPSPGAPAPAAGSVAEAPAPSTQPTAGSPTGYQVVGTVVATVNAKPIFADKVLATLERELAAEAHKYGPREFRAVAQQDIAAEIQKRVDGQLAVEQANAMLSQDAKNQADVFAQVWRRQQITTAGGSEAIARQRALDQGQSFDELVKEQYDTALVQLYYEQYIRPKIQVTASDMRRYYEENLQTDFSTHAEARYRLIRIDFARSGGPEKAAEKADRIIKDLKAGVAFEQEARTYNDDPMLMQSGGDMGWMQKGSYKFDKVEDAVWALQPHQFTDHPIEVSDPNTGSAFYIAYLEDRRGGNVQPFDSPVVQERIKSKLFSRQFQELLTKERQRLQERAAIEIIPNGLETAVDMAMQRYPVWAAVH
jgi:parvulin-like peptidyl-prolyl isomerase